MNIEVHNKAPMRRYYKWTYITICLFVMPLMVLGLIWFPVVAKYYIPGQSVSRGMVDKARAFPSKSVAQKIERFRLGAPKLASNNAEILKSAESYLSGIINIYGFNKIPIKRPFDEDLVHYTLANWALSYCGFLIPRLLIRAYDISRDEKYLVAARDFISSWAAYEETLWLPTSFVWNDHAISSRANVLSDFWVRYKDHDIFDRNNGRIILELVKHTAALLAKPKLYTYKTNHGTMQNIALLKLVQYFPTLPDIQRYHDVAVKRSNSQLLYYLNAEGMIAEHSSEYHKFGVGLVGATISMYRMMHIKVPSWMINRYKNSLDILERLMRPDHSLPAVGDTAVDSAHKEIQKPPELAGKGIPNSGEENNDSIVLLKSGYAIWWDKVANTIEGDASYQTVINWANYPYMGHKHADELGVNLWANGSNWLTGIGYWPYTRKDRKEAISWGGSNAPHYLNEKYGSERTSLVSSYVNNRDVSFIELIRHGENGFQVVRQIIYIPVGTWVIIDSYRDDKNRDVETVWTMGSEINIRKQGPGNLFLMSSNKSKEDMFLHISSSNNSMKIEDLKAEHTPLAGWNASGKTISPAHALITRQMSKTEWSLLTVTKPSEKRVSRFISHISEWENNNSWQVKIGDHLSVRRNGNEILVTKHDKIISQKVLMPKEKIQIDLENKQAYWLVRNEYGMPFRILMKYRIRSSYLVFVLIILSALGLLLCFSWNAKYFISMGNLIIVGWISVAIWINYSYLI